MRRKGGIPHWVGAKRMARRGAHKETVGEKSQKIHKT